jgi:predicted small lipoprotein YifL
MPIRTLIVILLALAVVSGCGRRGSLESPGATASTPSTSTAPATAISPLDPGSPPTTNDVTPPTPAEAPKKRFLLDFLL